MADDTHNLRSTEVPEVKTIRWCHWHQDVADDALLIGAAERNSGPPRPFYACAACRETHQLTPM